MNIEGKLEISRQDLEQVYTYREPRLSKSVRSHVRRLKKQGRFPEAIMIAQAARQDKDGRKLHSIEEEINRNVRIILQSDDSKERTIAEIKAIWLYHMTEQMEKEMKKERKSQYEVVKERWNEILETLNSQAPDIQAYVKGQFQAIREELKPFLPQEEDISKRR